MKSLSTASLHREQLTKGQLFNCIAAAEKHRKTGMAEALQESNLRTEWQRPSRSQAARLPPPCPLTGCQAVPGSCSWADAALWASGAILQAQLWSPAPVLAAPVVRSIGTNRCVSFLSPELRGRAGPVVFAHPAQQLRWYLLKFRGLLTANQYPNLIF